MSCESMRRSVWDRIDGGIDARAEAALKDHLASCGGCSAYSSQAERLDASLPQAFDAAAAPDIAPRILSRLAGAPVGHSLPEAWTWPAAGALFATALWTVQAWSLLTLGEGLEFLSSARSLLQPSEWASLLAGWPASLEQAVSRAGLIPAWWLCAAAALAAAAFVDPVLSRNDGDARRNENG